uniref:DNA_pol_B_exo1 domain-containing protein n=1 Tax=Panagrellus redivivus TaxID=6233 RepID=A0A7E4W031_PANRE
MIQHQVLSHRLMVQLCLRFLKPIGREFMFGINVRHMDMLILAGKEVSFAFTVTHFIMDISYVFEDDGSCTKVQKSNLGPQDW